MDEADLADFRRNLRLSLLEQLVLARALTDPVIQGRLSMTDSRQLLETWLDTNAASVGRMLGAHFREPAQTALFSDEAERVATEMKAILAKIAKVDFGQH